MSKLILAAALAVTFLLGGCADMNNWLQSNYNGGYPRPSAWPDKPMPPK